MAETETLKVELRPIEDVRPYSGNPRTITATAIDKVASSIREFGWRQPIVVDPAGVILVGHTRFLAAKKLKLNKVPVHVAVGLTADQAKAYRLADNRTHDEATWDIGALDAELKALQLTGFDLALTGFNFDQWPATVAGTADPDALAPAAPAKPITKLGDLWQLGDHRLLCGDSTDAAAVSKLLAGAVPNLMVSPPVWRPFNAFLHCWNPRHDGEQFHDHPRWSITICLRGELIERTPWSERTLRPGAFVFRSRKAIHAFEVAKPHRGKTWTIFIVGRRNHRQNRYVIEKQ